MGGDLTVANFLHVLGFAKNTVTNSIASIRAAKIRDINQLLGLTIQRLRVYRSVTKAFRILRRYLQEIGLDIDVILRIVHVARDILVELQWTDAVCLRSLSLPLHSTCY